MSCFWKGLIASFSIKDRSFFKLKNNSVSLKNIQAFVLRLQQLNTQTDKILWNNETLSDQQLQENYQHIQNYNLETINNGYDCSCSEPFLFLIAQLLQVNIVHDYDGNLITYTNTHTKGFRTLRFCSDREHFMSG